MCIRDRPWTAAAFVLGAYRLRPDPGWRAWLGRALNAWLVAAPLGLLLRSLLRGQDAIPVTFILVAMSIGGVVVGGGGGGGGLWGGRAGVVGGSVCQARAGGRCVGAGGGRRSGCPTLTRPGVAGEQRLGHDDRWPLRHYASEAVTLARIADLEDLKSVGHIAH